MTYLIQGDEFEIGTELRERLAEAIAACTELTITDARYRLRNSLGILRFDTRAEAERVAAQFTEMGFANFLLDELLPVPQPRLLGVGAPIPEEPIGLVVLALLETETTRVVADADPLSQRVGYGLLAGLGLETREVERVTEHETHYLLDLLTRESHWRVRSGALPRIVDVFTALDVTDARLNEGMLSLTHEDRRVPTFTHIRDHERYLMWLYQLRFA
ncbi:MAG: hypothetical protein ACE149_18530 [Armatimonadota bacterium]